MPSKETLDLVDECIIQALSGAALKEGRTANEAERTGMRRAWNRQMMRHYEANKEEVIKHRTNTIHKRRANRASRARQVRAMRFR
jgi:hypothetical protein